MKSSWILAVKAGLGSTFCRVLVAASVVSASTVTVMAVSAAPAQAAVFDCGGQLSRQYGSYGHWRYWVVCLSGSGSYRAYAKCSSVTRTWTSYGPWVPPGWVSNAYCPDGPPPYGYGIQTSSNTVPSPS